MEWRFIARGTAKERERESQGIKEGGNLTGSECLSSLALVVQVGGHIKPELLDNTGTKTEVLGYLHTS